MPETLRVLVHLDEHDGDFGPYRKTWETWEQDPDIHIIHWPDVPDEIHYLDSQYEQPKFVIVGGQTSYTCVYIHLIALAVHPKIKSGDIDLGISITATSGGYLQQVALNVNARTGVKVQIVD